MHILDGLSHRLFFCHLHVLVHVIQFEKCGLPYAHMLIWIHPHDRPNIIAQIENLISAEFFYPNWI